MMHLMTAQSKEENETRVFKEVRMVASELEPCRK